MSSITVHTWTGVTSLEKTVTSSLRMRGIDTPEFQRHPSHLKYDQTFKLYNLWVYKNPFLKCKHPQAYSNNKPLIIYTLL